MLGDGYEVKNFGAAGYGFLKSNYLSYWNSQQHMDALKSNPDIMVFMLGTNDS